MAAIEALFQKYPWLLNQGSTDQRDRRTVAEVAALYLSETYGQISEDAFAGREYYLTLFAKAFGHVKIAECSRLFIQQILRQHPTWRSAHTVRAFNTAIQRAFNFAVDSRFIRENPFAGFKSPTADARKAMADTDYLALVRN